MGALIQAVGDCIALQSFDDDVDGRFGRKCVLHAQLVGAFIADSDGAWNYLVAYAIYIFMELVRSGDIKRTRVIGEINTVKSSERPILTGSGLTGIPVQASSRITAAAIRFALGIQSSIGTPILAGRNQEISMRARYIWRLVPDSMRRAKIKFGSIITAAISHDGVVITRCTGKGVQAGGGGFVWRIGFAKLDSTICLTLKSDKAIARSETELLRRCVCCLI